MSNAEDNAGGQRKSSSSEARSIGAGGGAAGSRGEQQQQQQQQRRGRPDSESDSEDRRSPRSPRVAANPAEQFGRSPDVYVTLEKLMEAQEAFNNLVLAHEVAADENFHFETPEAAAAASQAAAPSSAEEDLERRVREVMHRAFWDLLAEDLAKTPPDYRRALTLIGDIRDVLLSLLLLPQHERMRVQIHEVLDLDLLKQKVEHDAFDMSYYSNYVLGVMARMCAPARDEAVRACAEIREPVPLFKEVFRLLELMKLDMANFTVQQMRPYIRQHAVAYERQKFDQLLATQSLVGVDGLRRTRAWLAEASAALPSADRSASRVVTEALLRLMDWRGDRPPLDEEAWPETLVVDTRRAAGIRAQLARLHCVCACVFAAMGILGPRLPEGRHAGFKERAKSDVMAVLADCAIDRLADAAAGLTDTLAKTAEKTDRGREGGGGTVDEKERRLLQAHLADLLGPGNAAAALLHTRLVAFLRESLADCHTRPVRLPAGYSVVESELAQVAGAFLRLCAHNRAVFGRLYDQLLAEINPTGAAAAAAST